MSATAAHTNTELSCYHCGEVCVDSSIHNGPKIFCCEGCKLVFEILEQNNLSTFYELNQKAGTSRKKAGRSDQFAYLDDAAVQLKLLDYQDEKHAKVRFYLPQIHCSSCIWLLENLQRLEPAVRNSRVHFLKREVRIDYDPANMSLSGLAVLLDSIGYTPEINLQDTENKQKRKRTDHRLALRIGVAAFAFGNIMLMSFPEYFHLDSWSQDHLSGFFGLLNIFLALPVVFYSASSYLQSAWNGLRYRNMSIDVPISLGVLTLFGWSVYEILSGLGGGYMDSLAGLVFFLLLGKWFQQKAYAGIAFDRDYRSYFPVAALRVESGENKYVPLENLKAGNEVIVHNGEIIPADALLHSDVASIDYSFVTGESDPVSRNKGERLFAGGKVAGAAVHVLLERTVSQSYLTSLWNDESFDKKQGALKGITDRLSSVFTTSILLIATASSAYWLITTSDAGLAVRIFTAVLIVACPCGLALTVPFTLGNVIRILGKKGMFIKSTDSVERFAQADTVVFDKTGTVTVSGVTNAPVFEGKPPGEHVNSHIQLLAAQSTHPLSRSIALLLPAKPGKEVLLNDFKEFPGQGLSGKVGGYTYKLGSDSWTGASDLKTTDNTTRVWVSQNGEVLGNFAFRQQYRPGLGKLLTGLRKTYTLALISGDKNSEQEQLMQHFGRGTEMHFGAKPADKLEYVRSLQKNGQQVIMVGDGLNDAGALQQSDAGIAISENTGTFSPACDAVLDARFFDKLETYLTFVRKSRTLVKAGLIISLMYNLAGMAFAVQGLLTPVLAAILMPLSSVSVVAFGTMATTVTGWRLGLGSEKEQNESADLNQLQTRTL